MPTLTIIKTVTYLDPETETPYTLTATKALICDTAHRTNHVLSASTSTKIWENDRAGLVTANPQYTAIKNVGDNSAYVSFNGGTVPFAFEVAAGAILDFFGENLLDTDTYNNIDALDSIYASGDTTLEVDVYM